MKDTPPARHRRRGPRLRLKYVGRIVAAVARMLARALADNDDSHIAVPAAIQPAQVLLAHRNMQDDARLWALWRRLGRSPVCVLRRVASPRDLLDPGRADARGAA